MSYEQKTWGRCFNIAKNFLHILGLLEAFYTRNSRQSPAHTMLQLPSRTHMAESNRARRKGGTAMYFYVHPIHQLPQTHLPVREVRKASFLGNHMATKTSYYCRRRRDILSLQ